MLVIAAEAWNAPEGRSGGESWRRVLRTTLSEECRFSFQGFRTSGSIKELCHMTPRGDPTPAHGAKRRGPAAGKNQLKTINFEAGSWNFIEMDCRIWVSRISVNFQNNPKNYIFWDHLFELCLGKSRINLRFYLTRSKLYSVSKMLKSGLAVSFHFVSQNCDQRC